LDAGPTGQGGQGDDEGERGLDFMTEGERALDEKERRFLEDQAIEFMTDGKFERFDKMHGDLKRLRLGEGKVRARSKDYLVKLLTSIGMNRVLAHFLDVVFEQKYRY
jgi:hypothetical protein